VRWVTDRGTSSVNVRQYRTFKVVSYEKISTPAGIFDAYRVEQHNQNIGMTFEENITFWFAPKIVSPFGGTFSSRVKYISHNSARSGIIDWESYLNAPPRVSETQ
jgi:hypothetical protein